MGSSTKSVLHQVLEIQACMPAPPTTTKRMMTGVYIAYAIVAWCYLGVGFSGYAAFGELSTSQSQTAQPATTISVCRTPLPGSGSRSQSCRLLRKAA